MSHFPPNWKNIHGVFFSNYFCLGAGNAVWNFSNETINQAEKVSWKETLALDRINEDDPLKWRDDILKNKHTASAFLMNYAIYGHRDIWNALAERDSEFLGTLWALAFGKYDKALTFNLWLENRPDSALRILSCHGWSEITESDDLLNYMPEVASEWRLDAQHIIKS